MKTPLICYIGNTKDIFIGLSLDHRYNMLVGVNEKTQKIQKIKFEELTVLSEAEYEEYKSKKQLIPTERDVRLGRWLSAMIEYNLASEEFRKDVDDWFSQFDQKSLCEKIEKLIS